MKKDMKSSRWILLVAGIIVVTGLTAMNVYSLYTLRNSSIETARQSKKIQVAEFSDRIRYRFFKPFIGLSSMEMKTIDQSFSRTGQFPKKTQHLMIQAAQDSIFEHIYYVPANSNACENKRSLLRFDSRTAKFVPTTHYSDVVCDGVGIARTRMRALISDYKYNNKVLFDTHRSMVIAMVNQDSRSVIGYLAMPVNLDFMVNNFLQPKLQESFGPATKSSLNVWLRDWTNGKIIASSNPRKTYNADNIEFRQQFPDFFDDWRLYASINEGTIADFTPSLWKNLIILGAAFVFLIGAMLFMFFTARRERALAERQSDFLANVTHELKTPIAVMQAAGENLADGRVDNQQRLQSYGSHIYSEAVRLQKMINRLLDVAKADAGQSFVHPKPVAPDKKLKEFIAEHRTYIKNKGFTLDISIADNIPLIMIDEQSLDTILSNLVNNAIKYSDGSKFIGITLAKRNKSVILQIEDHGVGMSKEAVNHIFEKFYRAEDTLTAKTKGYGLGLSIVKNMIDLNGGSIHVDSTEGRGSTFTLSFPAIRNLDEARNSTPAPSGQPITSSTH